MEIRKLPEEVQSAVRNGITIANTAQCIAELVYNALDAGADSVIIHLDITHYNLQVVDNGCGITVDNLKRVGVRYNTSKCRYLSDIQSNLKFYGYRGEALASLCESCGTLIIVTRPRNEKSGNTYCKTFSNGKTHHPTVSIASRNSAGTTVTVQDFMYNAPVRQRRINPNIDVEEIRMQVEALALSNPNVSFIIKDETDNSIILNVTKSRSTLEAFSKLYGEEITRHLSPVGNHTTGKHKIHGFISTSSHYNKRLQFIFVNGKLVKGTKLHKLINMIMRKSDVLRGSGPWQELPLPERVRDFLWVSPMKEKDRYCVFLVNIDCPLSEYDITLDPKKTLIEFCDWDSLLECMENLVKDFLKRNNLACVTCDNESFYSDDDGDSSSSVLNEVEKLDEEDTLGHKLKQFKNDTRKPTETRTSRTIHSKLAKRCLAIKNLREDANTSRGNENNLNELDESKLSFKISQAESIVSSKNNLIEKPVFSCGEELRKSPDTIDKNATQIPFPAKPKTKNDDFDLICSNEKFSSLGRFRNLFRQGENVSQKTPNDIQQIRIVKPPPIVKRKAPLEHRIKALVATKHSKSTGVNTVVTCSEKNTFNVQKKSLLMLDADKDITLLKKSSMDGITKCEKAAQLNYSTCNYSDYFKKAPTTELTTAHTVCDSMPLDAKSDHSENINFSSKDIIKPDHNSVDPRTEEALISSKKMASYTFNSINKDSTNSLRPKNTQHEPSLEIGYCDFPSSKDFICTVGDKMKNCKNNAAEMLKNDGNLTPSRGVTIGMPENLSHKISENHFLVSETTLPLEQEKNIVHGTGKLANVKSNEFPLTMLEENDLNQSEIDPPFHSESPQILSKQFTDPGNTSCTVALHISETSQEVVCDSAYEQNQKLLEKTSCQKTLSGSNFNYTLDVTLPTSDENFTTAIANADNATQKEDSFTSSKITFKNSNCLKSSQKRSLIHGDISGVLHKKHCMEKSLLNSEENDFSMIMEECLPKCDETATPFPPSNTKILKLCHKSANDSMLHDSFQGTDDVLNKFSSIDDLNYVVSPLEESFHELENNCAAINNLTKSEISLPQNNGENITHKDNDGEKSFEMFARQPFLPKGLSPILPKYSGLNVRMHKVQALTSCLAGSEDDLALGEKHVLSNGLMQEKLGQTRSKEESAAGTEQDISKESFISSFLSENENKKYYADCEVLSACVNDQAKSITKIHNLIYPCTFSKKVLKKFKMLGKLDEKFIIAQISMDDSMISDAIVLFDQHAVHERIRLEKLMKDYQVITKEDGDLKHIKYKSVDSVSSLEIVLSTAEYRMMERFPNHFERLGLYFERRENENHSDEITISFTRIPACLSAKDTKELGPLGLKEQVHTLIREQIENLVITRGLGTFFPEVLRDAINMEACRGAVKFGDSLSDCQCRWLLRKLSSCDSPFQCAHGRPSMYPLAAIRHLEKHCTETEQETKPRLWRIRDLKESGYMAQR